MILQIFLSPSQSKNDILIDVVSISKFASNESVYQHSLS
jgi:hypothetical protein